jgi:ABC-type multidrug transport system fused ATPase/permease subunit
MSFFDSNPVGRIISRLTTDVHSLDTSIALVLVNVTGSTMLFLVMVILISQASYFLIGVIIIIAALSYLVYRRYQPVNIELKRLSSNNKSPLITHVNECLGGLSLLRAYRLQDWAIQKQRKALDDYLVGVYLVSSINIWMELRLGLLSTMVTLVIGMIASQARNATSDVAAAVGLSLVYSSQLANTIIEFLSVLGAGEAEMNAVERLSHYVYDLEKEPAKELNADSKWPMNNSIQFRNVSISYPSKPNENVINDLSFSILEGQKIAIVGRTGSGKTTVVSALLRLLEPKAGAILVGNTGILY